MPNGFTSILQMLAAAIGLSIYLILLLSVESQVGIAALLVIGVIAVLASTRFRVTARLGRLFGERDSLLNLMIVLAVLIVTGFFYEDHFILLLVATVIIYVIACLGLNLQFGYSGVLNFAGAAFFGIGCYTAAVLTKNTDIPHLIILVAGGVMAALIGSILLLPVLRTHSHYSAVITIAFGLLFKIFLEVNDTLAGRSLVIVSADQGVGARAYQSGPQRFSLPPAGPAGEGPGSGDEPGGSPDWWW